MEDVYTIGAIGGVVRTVLEGKSQEVVGAKRKVIAACQILYKEGLWEFWGEGHPSARIDGTEYFALPGHKHEMGMGMGDVRSLSDVCVYDFAGEVVQGKYEPMDETCIHAAIYKAHKDVNGIAYTHPLYSKALASAGKDLLPVHHWAFVFGGRVPTLDTGGPVRSWAKAEGVAKALEGRNSLMLFNSHSVITTGKSIEEAVVLNIIFERAAKLQYMVELLGPPKLIPLRSEKATETYIQERIRILWTHRIRKYGLSRILGR